MAAFSLRIVDADYYLNKPIPSVDEKYSTFRQCNIDRVPIIRIFGATTKGQKTCLHVHGVFPYLYIPMPSDIADEEKFAKRFASSLDIAIHIAFGKAVSKQQHYVYGVQIVQRIPFYGYYQSEKTFLKIMLYNPAHINKASDLLVNGAVLNQFFQPFESHIPYILQFLIDYNLSGMNLVHISNIEFRQPVPLALADEKQNLIKSPLRSPLGSPIYSQVNSSVFNSANIPSFLLLPEDVAKQSTCPLEVDCQAKHILNKEYIQESLGKNPGLNLLWEDEKLRRRENHESSFIETPQSQARENYKMTSFEEVQLARLKQLLEERIERQEISHPSSSLQGSFSGDQSLVDILVDMPNDLMGTPNESISMNDSISNTLLSETILINNGLFEEYDEGNNTEEEVEESIMMSQQVTIENVETNKEEEIEVEEDIWSETFISNIPQLDGDDADARTSLHGVSHTLQHNTLSNAIPHCHIECNKCECDVEPVVEETKKQLIPQLDGGSEICSSDSSANDFKPLYKKKKKTKKKSKSNVNIFSTNTMQTDDDSNISSLISNSESLRLTAPILTPKKKSYIYDAKKDYPQRIRSPPSTFSLNDRSCSPAVQNLYKNKTPYPKRTRSLPIHSPDKRPVKKRKFHQSPLKEESFNRSPTKRKVNKPSVKKQLDVSTSKKQLHIKKVEEKDKHEIQIPLEKQNLLSSKTELKYNFTNCVLSDLKDCKVILTDILKEKQYNLASAKNNSRVIDKNHEDVVINSPKKLAKRISERKAITPEKSSARSSFSPRKDVCLSHSLKGKKLKFNSQKSVSKVNNIVVASPSDRKECSQPDVSILRDVATITVESPIKNNTASLPVESLRKHSTSTSTDEASDTEYILSTQPMNRNQSFCKFFTQNIDATDYDKFATDDISFENDSEQKNDESLNITEISNKNDEDNVNVTSENTNVASENMNVTSENMNVTSENMNVTSENMNVTSENMNVTRENMNVTSENMNVTSENMNVTSENMNVISENINVTTESDSNNMQRSLKESNPEVDVSFVDITTNSALDEKSSSLNKKDCIQEENSSIISSSIDQREKMETNLQLSEKLCDIIIIKPKESPPTRSIVLKTLVKYNLTEHHHAPAFYSNEEDAKSVAGVHSGQDIAATKGKISGLPRHTTGALKEFQQRQIDQSSIVKDVIINDPNKRLSELHEFINGDKNIVITPCKTPPSFSQVNLWLQQNSKATFSKKVVITENKPMIEKPTTLKTLNLEKKYISLKSPNEGKNIYTGKTSDPYFSDKKQIIAKEDRTKSDIGRTYPTPMRMVTPTNVLNKQQTLLQQNTPIQQSFTKLKPLKLIADQPSTSKEKQIKSPVLQLSCTLPWNTSDIEGLTPNNSFGFKFPTQNISEVKALHLDQHLTVISIELHVITRRDYKPDPSMDSITAIFYYMCKDASKQGDEKVKETGIYIYADTAKSNTGDLKKELLHRACISTKCLCFDSEQTMLADFATFVVDNDPDIILGYEVQMQSWGYLIERANILDINMCQRLSRISHDSNKNMYKSDTEQDNWFGQLVTMSITGRIILNVWRVMRSEVTLQIYTFENVLYHVLHRRVPCYSNKFLTDIWTDNTQRWRVCEYYMQRCQGNIELLDKIDFINRTSELARIFGILFYSVISRGSQFRVESMMLRVAKPLNFVPISPSVHQRAKMPAPECIQLVMEPESKFYVDPVVVLDFQSLYPSIIIAYNYCYSTCIGRLQSFTQNESYPFGASSLNLPLATLNELVEKNQVHLSPNGVGFVTSDVQRGILPRMLEEILTTRLMVKSAMKKAKNDKVLHKMLDSRQLGLKLIANVTYGYTAANFSGRMPCQEIADSVVRKGRETLERAIELVNSTCKWNARVVYGDTDSLFILLKGASKQRAFEVGKEIVDEVTAMNPKPVKLKFEKVYQPCVLVTKKRYVGYMYETLDQKEPVFDAKGIETIRRDNCPAVGKILEKSIRMLFETKNVSLIKSYIQKQFTKIILGKVILKDYTFAKEYRGMSSYKPGACVPALTLTRKILKKDRRGEPRVGERVPYVIVHGDPKLPLIQLVRTPHEVVNNPAYRINDIYYITKQICPSLGRIFSLLGVNVLQWFSDLPKINRVQDRELEGNSGNKKGTISHYFTSSHCPVCEQLTSQRICENCRKNQQETITTLSARVAHTERRYTHLKQLCRHCSGSQQQQTNCISLDCPIFYKLSNVERDINRLHVTRELIQQIL